jgi:LCP family protein required for cell wall assembly
VDEQDERAEPRDERPEPRDERAQPEQRDQHAQRPDERAQHAARGIARHGQLRPRRTWRTVLPLVASALAVVLVSGTSVAAIAAASLTNDVQTVHLGPVGKPNKTGAEAFAGAVDFVVVGSDTRAGQSEAAEGDPGTVNNDVTMLVHVSADHRQLTAVSIPRDLVTDLPACRNSDSGRVEPATRGMFNEALGRGGVQGGLSCVVDTVANLTGIQAEFAGVFKFDGVAAMSDAVGGVPVCIATPLHDPDVGLDLQAGEQTIQGQDASKFLRSRHGVGDASDLARISNQQLFLAALARKVTAPGGALSDPVSMYRLARAALHSMVVSDNLKDVNTMVSLASTLRGMDTSNMLFVQYPVVDDPDDPAHVLADPSAAHALNVALQTDAKTNLDDSSNGRGTDASSGGSTPSDQPTVPATEPATAPATPSASSTALPSSITGQSASQETCTKGNG